MKPSEYIIAKTDSYDLRCGKQPMERAHLNRHRAIISWQTGYGDERQAPGEIRLCVGGQEFIYKVDVIDLSFFSTDALLDEILRRDTKDNCGADELLDLLVDREILGYEDEDNDLGLYRKL